MAEAQYQRDVYGQTLVELGKDNPNIIVVDSDLSSSTRTALFNKAYPKRFFNFGVAEQNMMAAAAGLASCGKIVFASTFAIFATGRAWDQVRNTICYNDLNVKIVATHAGISVGEDGATHQALEDIALMRVIPNMKIVVPCDGPETKDAIIACTNTPGPFYIRLGRAKVASIEGKSKFELGRSYQLCQGNDLTIIACGIMVEAAIAASEILKKDNINARVINMHTIKPIDKEAILSAASQTKGIIVCEEHQVSGGLASSIDEIAAENHPTKVLRVAVKNRFGQSGTPKELFKEYNLTSDDIIKAARILIK